ncbi:MAG: hypothetical protein CVU86_01165 [Firmicutes bacterium HGW-Firmicutes-11]|jgi:hypothetical protein|nr:MAG: hypothetical protein CVU86_01165 [Firmicutes bacterium HGW-Firmicutes-11]
MYGNNRWNTTYDYKKALVLPVAVFLCFLLFFIVGSSRASQAAEKETLKHLESAVMQATVQCYAIEGVYPPDVAYLETHYGIQIDEDSYVVHYEAFASNILPTVFVIQK